MLPLLSIVLLGFVLGMRHATDPDHVVAVATIVSRERSLRAAAPLGLLWGLGHTTTIMIVGVAMIAFGVVIPPRVGLGMEFSVSLMLIALGAYNLATISRAGRGHLQARPAKTSSPAARGRIRALVVGVVHGLAGSAAIALLVLGTIREPGWAVAYLFIFGAGTVAGMMLVSAAMALPVALSAHKFERLHQLLLIGSALASVCFGAFLVYDIGFVHDLFGANPAWTPR